MQHIFKQDTKRDSCRESCLRANDTTTTSTSTSSATTTTMKFIEQVKERKKLATTAKHAEGQLLKNGHRTKA